MARYATTYEMPELAVRHPDLPMRYWSRDEDGYIGDVKYLGGARFKAGPLVESDSVNEQRTTFRLIVDTQPIRLAMRTAGRTRIVIRRWEWDSDADEWLEGPRRFVGRLNSATISKGVLDGEITASRFGV